jgi:hypothetical protein
VSDTSYQKRFRGYSDGDVFSSAPNIPKYRKQTSPERDDEDDYFHQEQAKKIKRKP